MAEWVMAVSGIYRVFERSIHINYFNVGIMKKLFLLIAVVAATSLCSMAQEVQSGVIEIGDYEDATEIYNGSYFDMAPTNFYLGHTGAQMIFTPDLLADLQGKENVQITGLKFKFNSESFEDINRDVKIYLQETDATEFAVVEGVKQFFNFGDLALEGNYTFDLLSYYGEDVEIEFPLSYALTPGKGLLVTIVFDAQDDENTTMGSDYAPFYTSGIRGKAMTYTDNWTSFVEYAQGDDFPDATAMLGCGTNVELPVTRIEYTYTEGGEPTLWGDVNMDGNVNIGDVTTLIDYLLGADVEPFNPVTADCNMDSNINIGDVTRLIDFLLSNEW